MHKIMDKLKLLDLIQTEYDFVKRTLSLMSSEQMLQPGASYGEWSVKDVVAHLAAWQNRFLGWFAASQRGETPELPAPGYTWEDLNRLNEQTRLADKDRPLDKVLSDFHASYEQIVEVVEAHSEEDLFDPDLYEWTSEQSPLWMYVAHNTYLHYYAHIEHVREWLADSQ